MSVSDTPKSRLETINFPGPAVVRAAGLNSWYLQVHCRNMVNYTYIVYSVLSTVKLAFYLRTNQLTFPASLQAVPGSDRAAIECSCSSPLTWGPTRSARYKNRQFCRHLLQVGHMYLLVVITEATLRLHTLHIQTVNNHPKSFLKTKLKGNFFPPASAAHCPATSSCSSTASCRSARPGSAPLARLYKVVILN